MPVHLAHLFCRAEQMGAQGWLAVASPHAPWPAKLCPSGEHQRMHGHKRLLAVGKEDRYFLAFDLVPFDFASFCIHAMDLKHILGNRQPQ